jgi:EmrB/QacA subfamily drug resistance transporter
MANTGNKFINIEPKWWILLAIGAGTFMSALDTSVVNTILPIVNAHFKSEVATVEWVVITYLLLVSGLLPSFGRLGDIYGHKSIYISGFFIFIFSSLMCALAPSIYALIGARAFQAIGAAMLSANSPAILTKSFPSRQRGQALGLQATMTYAGLITGPSLGGWLAGQFSWRAVFYINLPVGLIALILSVLTIPKDEKNETKEHFDIPGAVFFMGGLVSLLLGLNQGHNFGWSSLPIVLLISFSVICAVIFINIENRQSRPMLDLTLFKRRIFSTSVISAILNYICVYCTLFLMPFYLMQGRGFSSSQSGLILSAQPLIMAIIAPISGTISDKIGARIPGVIGMAILSAGLFMLSRLGLQTSMSYIVLGLGVTGLGIGIFISPNNSALMGAAPHNRQGIAAGILATARNIGMVLGIGFSGAIFTTIQTMNSNSNASLILAIQYSFMAAAIIAILGIFTTAIRGNTNSHLVRQSNSE